MTEDFVSTQWLADHVGDENVAIVDCTAFLPTTPRDAKSEFAEAHIPGTRFLDIAEVADKAHAAPHMLPSADDFATAMKRLGIGSEEQIIVYDNSPLRTAARGWFMFRHFGASNVAVLDGGMGKWVAEGRPVEHGEARPRPGRRFSASARAGDVVSKEDILSGTDLEIVDARSLPRFTGEDRDPRPNVAAGHIPGARCLPMTSLYREDGTFKDADTIRSLFADAGVDPSMPFIASCGSGVTANSLLLAARRVGGADGWLYDGSWSEWGADPQTPKATGPAD